MLTAEKLRKTFLDYFKAHGHEILPSASLIPENDATVLFTTAGMHPLVPYLLGEPHPRGKRLADVQKCVRTTDIDEVGDDTHFTFFEMLGNWSLGDYFKEQSIAFSYEFLTSKKYLGIDANRLAVSVFAGDEKCPRDEFSANEWLKLGIPKDRIFYLPHENNWWGPNGTTGPCGPDTEIFIDNGAEKCCDECSPACDCGKYVEIWNNVFMEYFKDAQGNYLPLQQKNVDTGMGLERTLSILNGLKNCYESDLFQPSIQCINQNSSVPYQQNPRAYRIIADHIRTSVMLIGDQRGITPSNTDQGYILRRLIRRAMRYGRYIGLQYRALSKIAQTFINIYKDTYEEIKANSKKIISELEAEEEKFTRALEQGIKEFEKAASVAQGAIDGVTAFRLYDTYGFPIEITQELATEKGLGVDIDGYEKAFKEHQQKSKAGSEQRFAGGLADNTEQTAKLHTATHLMHTALRKVLGDSVAQRGSNITAERLRFDFSFARPMTAEEIKQVENIVNDAIKADREIVCEEMDLAQAKQIGAIGLFEDKYGEKVKVYTMGEFSCEVCGGPHAASTGQLGEFVITKEQSSSSGVRRIKAELK